MDERTTLASVLVDHALAAHLVPWACPCDFGPEGRYRLEELVAASPHSLLYRATDKALSSEGFDAAVAVKIFRERSAVRNEALTVRRVSHPNVLAVLDRGTTAEGLSYLVAEYVDGGDLSQVEGPLPAPRAAALMAKVARAVQASHSAGVVHCDLKPANILLTKAGEPKLGDFGLARWEDDSPEASRGNVAFMSPEQFFERDDALTPPSDIYALGGLLYYLLVGRLPLGQTQSEVALAHRTRAAAPAPGIDRDLDRICQRAMSPSRESRHHSAGELGQDLERWLRHEPIEWAAPSPVRRLTLWARRRPRRAALLAAIATVLAVLAGMMQYNSILNQRRELMAQTKAAQLAKEQVEITSARVRKQIEWIARTFSTAAGPDVQDQLMPVLVWIEWLAGSPVIQDDGSVPGARERIDLLQKVISSAAAGGRSEHLSTLVSKYALLRLALAEGDSTRSQQLLADLEENLVPRLQPDDSMRLSLAAMRVCVEANAALMQGLPVGEFVPRLQEQDSILDRAGTEGATRRLVEKILDRCRGEMKRAAGA